MKQNLLQTINLHLTYNTESTILYTTKGDNMSTYEVETVFYNNRGGVQTKNYDLFNNKNQAVKHMNSMVKQKNWLVPRGKIKDGSVQLVDDNGRIKEQISLGQL